MFPSFCWLWIQCFSYFLSLKLGSLIWDLSSNTSINAINLLLKTASAPCHTFWYIVFLFSFTFIYILIYLILLYCSVVYLEVSFLIGICLEIALITFLVLISTLTFYNHRTHYNLNYFKFVNLILFFCGSWYNLSWQMFHGYLEKYIFCCCVRCSIYVHLILWSIILFSFSILLIFF